MPTILFDGWPLIYKPNSPESLHILDLLSYNPQGVKPVIALPAEPPSWLPKQLDTIVRPSANKPWNRLVWEQMIIPGVFKNRKASLIHLTRPTVPLSQASSTVVSPAGFPLDRSKGIKRSTGGIWERVREATAFSAAAQARGFFWPSDLPDMENSSKTLTRLPPLLPSDLLLFEGNDQNKNLPDLPETFILYHGPGEIGNLMNLLNGWSWAAGSIGDYYPLLVMGFSLQEKQRITTLLKEYHLEESVRILAEVPPWQIPLIYKKSSALFHPSAGSPWSGPLRIALAAHIPIVATEEALNSALVKKAAYLIQDGDSRAMGAAIISIVIEESIAESLSEAARIQTEGWNPELFKRELLAAYQEILKTT